MATQTSEKKVKKVEKNIRNGSLICQILPNRGTRKTIGPWAKLCSGSQTSTHYRSYNINRENMPEYGQR